jgi:hypothetical protein
MHPKNRMEKAIALNAIADTADKMREEGAGDTEVKNFIIGARGKLSQERPDPENYAKATAVAAKWGKQNL